MENMITKSDYEKSVTVSLFVKAIRDISAEKEGITEILFTPVVGGYEISYVYDGKNVRITAAVKGFFNKRLILKKYIDGKETATYRVGNKEEIFPYTEQILTE